MNAEQVARLALQTALVKTGVLSEAAVQVARAVEEELAAQRAVDRVFNPKPEETVATLRAYLARLDAANR